MIILKEKILGYIVFQNAAVANVENVIQEEDRCH